MDDSALEKLCDNAISAVSYLWERQPEEAFPKLNSYVMSLENAQFVHNKIVKKTSIEDIQKTSGLYDKSEASLTHLNGSNKPSSAKSIGKDLFNMEQMSLDENLKRDLSVIQLRNYLDPKR